MCVAQGGKDVCMEGLDTLSNHRDTRISLSYYRDSNITVSTHGYFIITMFKVATIQTNAKESN